MTSEIMKERQQKGEILLSLHSISRILGYYAFSEAIFFSTRSCSLLLMVLRVFEEQQ